MDGQTDRQTERQKDGQGTTLNAGGLYDNLKLSGL